MIVVFYFLFQVRQAHNTFIDHAKGYSAMLARVIELNARGAVLSEEIVEKIMETFLGNAARFVDYLDLVEPFSSDELAAFAKEAGLAGICIKGENGVSIEGPSGWLGTNSIKYENDGKLRHLLSEHLYFLSHVRQSGQGYILVGLTAVDIEKLHEQVGLPYLLATLPDLAGIRYVRIEKYKSNEVISEVQLTSDRTAAETRLKLGDDTLVVALDTRHFLARVTQLRNEFFVFSAILAMLGIFFSWLLHRYQTAYMNQIRDFERQLARQHEDAALGKAAAAITHEIRNPLNAISMGLQRLHMEIEDMEDEYRLLIANMLKAVQRTNGIVTNLRRYARPLEPRRQPACMKSIINHILTLYWQKFEENHIAVVCNIHYEGNISGDSELLEEVMENLIKNAIEAQPEKGFMSICLERDETGIICTLENGGFELPAEEAERILEPYFTTKTRGTGLGMAIAARIIQAHGGHLNLHVPENGLLRIVIKLPVGEF